MDVSDDKTIRDAFERWYSEDWEWRIAVRRDSRGEYIYSGAATAWKVWKAAVEYTNHGDNELASVLPGPYYMDPQDGGDVSIIEQLRRMSKDAERYRYLRQKAGIAAAEFDRKLDAEMGNCPCSMVHASGERNA